MNQSEMAFRELRANWYRKGYAKGEEEGGGGEKVVSLQHSRNDTYVTYFWREVTLFFLSEAQALHEIFSPYISSFVTNLRFA